MAEHISHEAFFSHLIFSFIISKTSTELTQSIGIACESLCCQIFTLSSYETVLFAILPRQRQIYRFLFNKVYDASLNF